MATKTAKEAKPKAPPERLDDTKQCFVCKEWINLGTHNRRRTWENHLKKCSPEEFAKTQASKAALIGPEPEKPVTPKKERAPRAPRQPRQPRAVKPVSRPEPKPRADAVFNDNPKELTMQGKTNSRGRREDQTELAGEMYRSNLRGTVLLNIRKGGDWAGKEEDGGRYVVQCLNHNTQIQSDKRLDAHELVVRPWSWCKECAAAIGENPPERQAKPRKNKTVEAAVPTVEAEATAVAEEPVSIT